MPFADRMAAILSAWERAGPDHVGDAAVPRGVHPEGRRRKAADRPRGHVCPRLVKDPASML
eukprot:540701-Pyramimonas_sp.AAC.1